ncbi:UbiH/UbiF/VisC/COQ6 family ubiquinone biosynthesis hydroxylase [Bordetella sp. 02P26C-1]|uniref:UbiH/UbiF/VisC/COQ6 family ubiquinone biosynthesis hydroxylase n=1 Tax=Bordetella sp. 02P26C-1 TaxID=2683195 RepID=UPI001352424E|nr:UbiH/UbiF/VisC/COQ6 family ubiquinone biosynthesis hydroxylase [Bordetella sp. 02P26C-1]MVW77435.1 UbiH/UbiF/VisC/COQ6 family ubiquinone biosynthesis hydroxylase [Bordetella sp. 02P26C-1]
MTQPAYDIAILGAGPVGHALALLLARQCPDPQRIALLAGTPPAATGPAREPGQDPRVLAMNHGSRVLLESLGAWPSRAADIRHVHVSQRGRLGSTVIHHTDFQVPRLGSVVPYAALHATLHAAVADSGVTVLQGPSAQMVNQDGAGVEIRQGDTHFRARLAVQSDGSSGTDLRREYDQHAIVTTAYATLPRAGWAWERFTREGPLALLPHPLDARAYSVVWCNAPERAAALSQLDEAAFSAALTEAFGTRLGRLSSQAARHVFPLALNARRTQVQGRLVAIGNAAQTLHPVAGQGLNLGLRDAARLAQALAAWSNTPEESPNPLLAQFANARRADRLITGGLTDLMPRAFATGLAPVEHACGLGLLALDAVAPLRAPLARHLLQGLRV